MSFFLLAVILQCFAVNSLVLQQRSAASESAAPAARLLGEAFAEDLKRLAEAQEQWPYGNQLNLWPYGNQQQSAGNQLNQLNMKFCNDPAGAAEACQAIQNHADSAWDAKGAQRKVLESMKADVERILPIESPGNWMIVDGQLYLHKSEHRKNEESDANINFNLPKMIKLVESILEHTCETVPDVTFSVQSGPGGTPVTKKPILAITRKLLGNKMTRGGILVPNPYFDTIGDWNTFSSNLLETGRRTDWNWRSSQVFWRGATWGKDRGSDGNRERVQASGLSDACPSKFNMKLTNMPDTKKGEYCHFKYLMNLPGGHNGTYSRNLNHLWTTGSVVLQWKSEWGMSFDEWYYPGLQDGVTHIESSSSNLPGIVDCLRQNDAAARNIGRRGLEVHNTFLCPNCLERHFFNVFQALSTKMRINPKDVLAQNASSWVKYGGKSSHKGLCQQTNDGARA